MGILSRIRNIMGNSISSLIDGMENPEDALNNMIVDMEKSIEEMRENTASAMATTKLTERKLEKSNKASEDWLANAEDALRMGDEELAKKALVRKKSVDENIRILDAQFKESTELTSRLKEELKLLDEKLIEAKLKKDVLIDRHRAAQSRKKIHEASMKVSTGFDNASAKASNLFSAYEGFGKFEEKIEKQLAEIEAREELTGRGLDVDFEKMRRDRQVEDELAKLKAIVKKK